MIGPEEDAGLAGKVALISGGGAAGDGIGNGRAAAILLARAGTMVLVADRDLGLAERTVEMIAAEGGAATAAAGDVTDEADCRRLVEAALDRFGRLDFLDNNVGIGSRGSVVDEKPEQYRRVMQVNVESMFLLSKYAIPAMIETARAGAIVNISSMAAITSYPYVAYKATKAAMIAFTEQLAYQNAQYGIRANVILPGLMNTPMAVDTRARDFNKTRAEVEAERDNKVPLRRKMGTAWDVANAALFLASDEANFITGVTLPVDGGASVRRG